jgi:hypothetical protein
MERGAGYNFCRVHMTLRVTPAMEAGLTDPHLDGRRTASERNSELNRMSTIPERSLVIAFVVVFVTLAGYVWIAWKVSPLKAMVFGAASTPAGFLIAYAVQYSKRGLSSSLGECRFWLL